MFLPDLDSALILCCKFSSWPCITRSLFFGSFPNAAAKQNHSINLNVLFGAVHMITLQIRAQNVEIKAAGKCSLKLLAFVELAILSAYCIISTFAQMVISFLVNYLEVMCKQ